MDGLPGRREGGPSPPCAAALAGGAVRTLPGSPPVTVLSPGVEEGVARLVARQVREALGPAARMLGTQAPPFGEGEIWVVVVGSSREMSGMLGGRYGSSTLGAYWRGILVVLSPRAWLDVTAPGWEERFAREGPVVHEVAHLLLDRATLGRAPAWLDEGIAQYVEYALTGYEWTEDDEGMANGGYPLSTLARSFRELPDEAVAYREAFVFVCFLVERRGEGALAELASRLRRGEDGLSAAAAVAGVEREGLEAAWRAWLRPRS